MKLIFLGDSLMQPNGQDTYPQTGWPQKISLFLKKPSDVEIADFALNGRSTKSFIDEGRFDEAYKVADEGDICFISFGHNDEKSQDPTRYTLPYGEYQKNLTYMYKKMKEKGVESIFITSVSRLKYDENNVLLHTHGEYIQAMKDLAKKLNRPLVDLEKLTYDDLSNHSLEENQKHYMILKPNEYENYPEGKNDTTHMTENGAKWICSLVVPELKKIDETADLFL